MSSDGANLADFLTPDQQASLTMFQEITQISDNDLSLSILTEFNFNVDNAVNNFLNQGATSPHTGGNTNSQSSMSSGTSTSGSGNGTWTTHTGDDNSSTSTGNENNTTSAVVPQQNTGIWGLLSRPLNWIINTRGTVLNPDADTRKFNDEFDRKFMTTHPKFFNRSYTQAVEHAFRNQKFLLVYLHSPLHEDTNKFCQQGKSTLSHIIISIVIVPLILL
jgi:FAS-associated factor 2